MIIGFWRFQLDFIHMAIGDNAQYSELASPGAMTSASGNRGCFKKRRDHLRSSKTKRSWKACESGPGKARIVNSTTKPAGLSEPTGSSRGEVEYQVVPVGMETLADARIAAAPSKKLEGIRTP